MDTSSKSGGGFHTSKIFPGRRQWRSRVAKRNNSPPRFLLPSGRSSLHQICPTSPVLSIVIVIEHHSRFSRDHHRHCHCHCADQSKACAGILTDVYSVREYDDKQLDSHSSCSLPKKLQGANKTSPRESWSFRGKTNKSVADICRTHSIPFTHESRRPGPPTHWAFGSRAVHYCKCN
jgi:hypothetical protein